MRVKYCSEFRPLLREGHQQASRKWSCRLGQAAREQVLGEYRTNPT